jgi:hypothetical protein
MTRSINYKFIGYWEGYPEKNAAGVDQRPLPLNEIPDYFTHVPIAFCAPIKAKATDRLATTWDFDSSFVYTRAEILQWVVELKRKRGDAQKILLSVMDTPDIHWSTDVNIPAFAKNIAKDIYLYGLDGVDIDAESGMTGDYAGTFILLIQSIREELDVLALVYPALSKKIISYTCYTGSDSDRQILAATKDHIEYLTTMAYWDNTAAAIALLQEYAGWIGSPQKVGYGVECPPQGTNLADAILVAEWLKANNSSIIMLWSATRDVTAVSGLSDGAYAKAMLAILSNLLFTEKFMLLPALADDPKEEPKEEPTEIDTGCFSLLSSKVKSLFCCFRGCRTSAHGIEDYKQYKSPKAILYPKI